MSIIAGLTIFSISYLCVPSFVYLSKRRLNSYGIKRHGNDFIFLKSGYRYLTTGILIVSPLILLFFGAKYIRNITSFGEYYTFWLSLLVSLVITFLVWFPKPPDWIINNKKKIIKLPISPIDNIQAAVKWFLFLCLLFVLREGLHFLILGRQLLAKETEIIFSYFLRSGIYAPLVEETVFRWFPQLIGGEVGLVIGTAFWLILHPIQLYLNNISLWIILSTIVLLWLPVSYVYIKLWKGKYFWLSYLMHTFFNVLIIILPNYLGIPS